MSNSGWKNNAEVEKSQGDDTITERATSDKYAHRVYILKLSIDYEEWPGMNARESAVALNFKFFFRYALA